MNDLDALMTDIRELIAAWCAGQVRAAVTPVAGERRGEPRKPWHYWDDHSNSTACGIYSRISLLLINHAAGVTSDEAALVTCQGCMNTPAYKTAMTKGTP